MAKDKNNPSKREHIAHFNLAGFSYYEGALVFNELSIGTKLTLEREPENHHDKYAVAVYYNETKIGFLPRSENRMLAKLLDAGVECFELVVNRLDPTEHPESQVGIILYVVN